MSEPKRYGHKAIIYPKSDDDTYITIPVEQQDGQWVDYSDYARLKAEVERVWAENAQLHKGIYSLSLNVVQLKDEVERMTALVESNLNQSKVAMANSDAYVRSLEARVERLTNAGYAMAVKINVHGINDRFTDSQKLVDDWSNVAKENPQP
jgi:hypothetical protein